MKVVESGGKRSPAKQLEVVCACKEQTRDAEQTFRSVVNEGNAQGICEGS